ncbi:MAG: holo-ACP synthase [bacterium]
MEVARLEAALARWPRLAERLFTQDERDFAARRVRQGEHLAARFAAKEAAFKALGTGWPRLSWQEVEVASSIPSGGRPQLRLSGRAAELAGGAQPAISLAHDGGLAVAQVLLVEGPGC